MGRRTRRHTALGGMLGAAAALLIAITACAGGGQGEGEGEGADANVRYASVDQIRQRVESTGVTCTGWRLVENPINAIERAVCTDDLTFATHTDAEQVRFSVDIVATGTSTILDAPAFHLVGPNWALNCGGDAGMCEDLQHAVGGELEMHEP